MAAPAQPPPPPPAAPSALEEDWSGIDLSGSAPPPVAAPPPPAAAPAPPAALALEEPATRPAAVSRTPPELGGVPVVIELPEPELPPGPVELAPLHAFVPSPEATGHRPGAAPVPAADAGEARLREALSQASRDVIERVVWEVVPQLAETIIREHVDRLVKERQKQ